MATDRNIAQTGTEQCRVVTLVPRIPRERVKVKLIEGDGLSSSRGRSLFFAIDGALNAAMQGDRKACSRAVHAADARLSDSASSDAAELRIVLRARCGLCPDQCKKRLRV